MLTAGLRGLGRWGAGIGTLGLIALGTLDCGPSDSPPPRSAIAPIPVDDDDPMSSEWLYVTEGVAATKAAECASVLKWIQGEKGCVGASCVHGATLAKDWLTTCKKSAEEKRKAVEELNVAFAARAEREPSACDEEGESIRRGCKKQDECVARARKWATKCASTLKSPLSVKMIEANLSQATKKRIKLDVRNCEQLWTEVAKKSRCDQQFDCQDALPSVADYKTRCIAEGQFVTIAQAVTEFEIRLGAGETPKPIAIDDTSVLDPKKFPLSVPDGTGVFLRVCGDRPNNLLGYLKSRASCEDSVLYAKRIKGAKGHVLATSTIKHAGDELFRQRFPALDVIGEGPARAAGHLTAQIALLRKAASRVDSDPAAAFAEAGAALAGLNHRLGKAETRKALSAMDQTVLPIFARLARDKSKLVTRKTKKRDLRALASRAEQLPFADLTTNGQPRIGADSCPGVMVFVDQLKPALPRSVAMYVGELAGLLKKARRYDLRDADDRAYAAAQQKAFKQCADESKRLELERQGALGCVFASCDPPLAQVVPIIDKSRTQAQAYYAAGAFNAASRGYSYTGFSSAMKRWQCKWVK